jgi:zinc protease
VSLLFLGWLTTVTASAVDVPHETFTLENGLEVVLIPDRRLPKVVVDVWYDVGSYDDPPGRSGFAHLFEHLMFKGTDRVGEGEFDSLMEQAGGWNNATTSDERTNYFNVGPSSALELLLWLEADRMTSLSITQAKLDVEREVVRNEKRQNYEDRPYGEVWIALPAALYPAANPLHRPGIGSHQELMAATVEDVRSFYETWYVPSNAVLAVAGDFDPAETRELIQRLFGPLPARPRPNRVVATMPTEPVLKRDWLQDDVSAPMQLLACHTPKAMTEQDAALDVLAHVLTGSPDARLSRAFVHTGRVRSVDASMWSGRWSGVFAVRVMHHPLDATEAYAATRALHDDIFAELGTILTDRPVTRDEIERAVRNLEFDSVRDVETLLGRAERLQRYKMLTGEFDAFDQDLGRYRRVTPEAIAQEVQRLVGGACAEIAVGPRSSSTGEGGKR